MADVAVTSRPQPAPPRVNEISLESPWEWLSKGWDDLKRAPKFSLTYGTVFFLISVLMIRRAEREGDPWSGHMAFPGGRSEHADPDSLATARRETLEEIGLDLEAHCDCLGRLSDLLTRPGIRGGSMCITPYLFALESAVPFSQNVEVDEIHRIPLAFLADRGNRQRMRWRPNGVAIDLPCYFYADRRIWGLSLMMLDELVEVLY